MRWLLAWLASKLPSPRVIYDGEGRTPYLTRYYLFGRPSMPDGSEPFDGYGDQRPGAVYPDRWWRRWTSGVFLHKFHRSDSDRELHDHPWRWGLSLILSGGYREERRSGIRDVVTRVVRPGRLNFLRHGDHHRVDLLGQECWSLFVVGPKASSWSFWDRETGEIVHWREFLARKRAKVGIAGQDLEGRDD